MQKEVLNHFMEEEDGENFSAFRLSCLGNGQIACISSSIFEADPVMKELIGECKVCRKPLYCLDGFFNGIHEAETGKVVCFQCEENQQKETEE
ncbi:hypothetical protein [Bacillus sp. AK031]